MSSHCSPSSSVEGGRMTNAFTCPSPLRHSLKCLLNLSLREQSLLPVLRPIYAHVEPIIDPLLPQEQAGFRHGRSTVDQVTLLTQDIADSFSAKKKAGAMLVDPVAYSKAKSRPGPTIKMPPFRPVEFAYNDLK